MLNFSHLHLITSENKGWREKKKLEFKHFILGIYSFQVYNAIHSIRLNFFTRPHLDSILIESN